MWYCNISLETHVFSCTTIVLSCYEPVRLVSTIANSVFPCRQGGCSRPCMDINYPIRLLLLTCVTFLCTLFTSSYSVRLPLSCWLITWQIYVCFVVWNSISLAFSDLIETEQYTLLNWIMQDLNCLFSKLCIIIIVLLLDYLKVCYFCLLCH